MCTNSESSVDGVLVISCHEQPPEDFIQNILGMETLPSAVVGNNCVKGYKWKIDTKYYSATVNLYAVQEKQDFDSDFCETVQAIVFFFNGKEPSSFENILSWMPLLKSINAEVQLLVCENCSSEATHKKNTLNWCVENQFELIETNVQDESDDEEGGIFSKSKGFGRVIEALQSHTWSNLVMKKNVKPQPLSDKTELEAQSTGDSSCSSSSKKADDSSKKVIVGNDEVNLEEPWLQNVLGQEDPGGESLEALFAKFASMKEKASRLTGDERKKYAEKVAIEFWKATGWDEEEIKPFDDDDSS